MFTIWLLSIVLAGVPHDPHQAGHDRSRMAMGFDQDRTAHHFLLYDDGGAIDIVVRDASDSKNRDAIRSHLPHVAMMFGDGDFAVPMLVHDVKTLPGAAVLAQRKEMVTYRYVETPLGGRVDIVTADRAALDALHQFLRYQIHEHQTGDPATVATRK